MKIYLLIQEWGEYADYSFVLVGAYSNKESAQELCDKYNKEAESDRRSSRSRFSIEEMDLL